MVVFFACLGACVMEEPPGDEVRAAPIVGSERAYERADNAPLDPDDEVLSPTLAQCQKACELGSGAMHAFCATVPPAIRGGCRAVANASETACKGWCYWHFGPG